MKRRLLQVCFALGLLLTLAACGLWVRTWWTGDRLAIYRQRTDGDVLVNENLSVLTGRGHFTIAWTRWRPPRATPTAIGVGLRHQTGRNNSMAVATNMHGSLLARLGFDYQHAATGRLRQIIVSVPPWFAVLWAALLAATPGQLLWRERRRRGRVLRGLCPTCGYDLRGAAHERCPECGQAVVAAASHGEPSPLSKMK